MFELILNVNEKQFKAEADTILEALETIKHPDIYKTRGELIVKSGELTAKRNLPIGRMKKLWEDRTWREVMAKTLTMFLK
jgi:hypothetical protein